MQPAQNTSNLLSITHDGRKYITNSSHSEEELKNHNCSICFQFMKKPVKVCESEQSVFHRFCKDCIEHHIKVNRPNCPLCNRRIKKTEFDVDDVFNQDFKFLCPNHQDGCDSILTLTDILTNAHINNCPEELVQCPYNCTEDSDTAETPIADLISSPNPGQPGSSDNQLAAPDSLTETQTDKPPQKIKKLKRKELEDHINNLCPKLITCECGEKTFPGIQDPEIFMAYMAHISKNPTTHNITRLCNFILTNRLSTIMQPIEKVAVIAGQADQAIKFLGHNCLTTHSPYLLKLQANPRAFFLRIPAGTTEHFEISPIVFPLNDDSGKKVNIIGSIEFSFNDLNQIDENTSVAYQIRINKTECLNKLDNLGISLIAYQDNFKRSWPCPQPRRVSVDIPENTLNMDNHILFDSTDFMPITPSKLNSVSRDNNNNYIFQLSFIPPIDIFPNAAAQESIGTLV